MSAWKSGTAVLLLLGFSACNSTPDPSGTDIVRGSFPEAQAEIAATRAACTQAAAFTPEGYKRIVNRRPADGSIRLVEERLDAIRFVGDELDNLVGAAPSTVRAWMERKARLADGARPGVPVCDGQSISRVIEESKACVGSWTLMPNLREQDAWALAETGLLRVLAGLTIERVALATGSTTSKVRRRLALHAKLMTSGGEYTERVGDVAAKALAACNGPDRGAR